MERTRTDYVNLESVQQQARAATEAEIHSFIYRRGRSEVRFDIDKIKGLFYNVPTI